MIGKLTWDSNQYWGDYTK